MRENIDILGVFHDGSIVEIVGELPNISLRIEIEYLRNMFSPQGSSFMAQVSGCEHLEFYHWENDSRINVPSEIQEIETEILSVKQRGDVAHLMCTTGELEILYKDIVFQLDSGESVTYKALDEASNKYWDDWQSRNST